MFADYRSLVIQDYKQKAAAGAISSHLTQPRRAKLRDECLAVCSERYNRKDEQILRTFFGQGHDRIACLQAIRGTDPDKFRPLANFLKDPTIDTDPKNIELLAWLIDFQRRPFELGGDYSENNADSRDNDDKGGSTEDVQKDPTEEPTTIILNISGKPESNQKRKIIILTVVIALGMVIIWKLWDKTPSVILTGHEKCMYWTGDHYEPVSCSQKMGNTLVVALDSERLIHFRRIMQTDTITLRSVGVVGCVKVKGTVEFYTTSGSHPTEIQLRVRPATEHMITKYILNKDHE